MRGVLETATGGSATGGSATGGRSGTGTPAGAGSRALGLLALAEARRWIGTPYRHQASCRGAGADCLGLLRGVWRALYGAEPAPVPPYTPDWDEPARAELLWQAARRHLVEKPLWDAAPGDVLLFRMARGAVAKHLGIAGRVCRRPGPGAAPLAGGSFVHAYSRHGVVENALTPPWARRIVARFAFPAGAGAAGAGTD